MSNYRRGGDIEAIMVIGCVIVFGACYATQRLILDPIVVRYGLGDDSTPGIATLEGVGRQPVEITPESTARPALPPEAPYCGDLNRLREVGARWCEAVRGDFTDPCAQMNPGESAGCDSTRLEVSEVCRNPLDGRAGSQGLQMDGPVGYITEYDGTQSRVECQ